MDEARIDWEKAVDPAAAVDDVKEKFDKYERAKLNYEAAKKIDAETEKRFELELRLGKLGSEIDRSNASLALAQDRGRHDLQARGDMDAARTDWENAKGWEFAKVGLDQNPVKNASRSPSSPGRSA